MTKEQQASLQLELDDAYKIEDATARYAAVNRAQSHILVALMDCQRKTSERVKRIQGIVISCLFGGGTCGAAFAPWHKIVAALLGGN